MTIENHHDPEGLKRIGRVAPVLQHRFRTIRNPGSHSIGRALHEAPRH